MLTAEQAKYNAKECRAELIKKHDLTEIENAILLAVEQGSVHTTITNTYPKIIYFYLQDLGYSCTYQDKNTLMIKWV